MSNPAIVYKNWLKYKGSDDAEIYLSERKDKKFCVTTPDGKTVHFGQKGYDDYTSHQNEARRDNYLKRSSNIRGNWRNNKYSANNLAINLLWQ